MTELHYLLWAYFLLFPLYVYLTINKDKQAVADNPNNRVKLYQSTMLHLWLPTLLVGAIIYSGPITLADIGLKFSPSLLGLSVLTISIIVCAYLLYSLKAVKTFDHKQIEQTKAQLNHVKWFMPHNKQQTKWMVYGVSPTAGICEEILFRGFLLFQLSLYMNEIYAVIISSIAFGLGHIYQGWQHVIRTGIVGAIFAGIYIVSDSLLAPILLHTIMDAYGGQLAYLVNKPQQESKLAQT